MCSDDVQLALGATNQVTLEFSTPTASRPTAVPLRHRGGPPLRPLHVRRERARGGRPQFLNGTLAVVVAGATDADLLSVRAQRRDDGSPPGGDGRRRGRRRAGRAYAETLRAPPLRRHGAGRQRRRPGRRVPAARVGADAATRAAAADARVAALDDAATAAARAVLLKQLEELNRRGVLRSAHRRRGSRTPGTSWCSRRPTRFPPTTRTAGVDGAGRVLRRAAVADARQRRRRSPRDATPCAPTRAARACSTRASRAATLLATGDAAALTAGRARAGGAARAPPARRGSARFGGRCVAARRARPPRRLLEADGVTSVETCAQRPRRCLRRSRGPGRDGAPRGPAATATTELHARSELCAPAAGNKGAALWGPTAGATAGVGGGARAVVGARCRPRGADAAVAAGASFVACTATSRPRTRRTGRRWRRARAGRPAARRRVAAVVPEVRQADGARASCSACAAGGGGEGRAVRRDEHALRLIGYVLSLKPADCAACTTRTPPRGFWVRGRRRPAADIASSYVLKVPQQQT